MPCGVSKACDVGRARSIALGIVAALVTALPAVAQTRAEMWAVYRPAAERVQSITAWSSGNGLYAAVVQPVIGTSRIDVINPIATPNNPPSYPIGVVPTDPGHGVVSIETDRWNNLYTSIGPVTGIGSPESIGVKRKWANDIGALPDDWKWVIRGRDFPELQMPYGIAFHPSGRMYVADARAGLIAMIESPDQPYSLYPVRIVSRDTRFRPAGGDAGPLPGVTGRIPLGITGIAVCPSGGPGMLCSRAGNLLVNNSSTGVVYEVPVLTDGTTGEPVFRTQFTKPAQCSFAEQQPECRRSVLAIQFGPDGVLYYVENSLPVEHGRVRGIDMSMSYPAPLAVGCPLSGPSDVAFAGGFAFIANRSALLDDADADCPVPSVVRVAPAG